MPLGQRAFDVLHALIERRERLVAKNELLDLVWPGVVVEENNLQVQISSLRKLLGPEAIATVPGRGYRFTAALDGANDSDPRSAGTGPAADAAKMSAPSPLTNLPKELPALYGREGDLQALCSLIDRHRLVTVVGAGGIGKSRVAQAAAHSLTGRWRDGVWMVELAGLSDPELLANTVAQALACHDAGSGNGAGRTGRRYRPARPAAGARQLRAPARRGGGAGASRHSARSGRYSAGDEPGAAAAADGAAVPGRAPGGARRR